MGESIERARELLAAELACSPDSIISVVNFETQRSEVPVIKAALRAIEKAIADERAAIVKWLRDPDTWHLSREKTAAAIESGDHHKSREASP